MQISNEEPPGDGAWSQLIRLQSEYQARLAEETIKYLRGLQAAFIPRAPGTIVQPNGARLTGSAAAGGSVTLHAEIENRQRVHTPVSPAVTPLVSDDGRTWYPVAELEPVAMLIGPDETSELSITLQLPDELAPGTFRGALVLQGFLVEGVPLEITVIAPPDQPDTADRDETQP